MKQVFKYQVAVNPRPFTVGKIVGFGIQNGTYTFWAETSAMSTRVLIVVGTGWEIEDGATHLFTTQADGFVWHLYELAQGEAA